MLLTMGVFDASRFSWNGDDHTIEYLSVNQYATSQISIFNTQIFF
jgi:hypothetical protein